MITVEWTTEVYEKHRFTFDPAEHERLMAALDDTTGNNPPEDIIADYEDEDTRIETGVTDREITDVLGDRPVTGQTQDTASFRYWVTVDAATQEEADQVMSERLNPDEDYGFDYTLGWDRDTEGDGDD